MRRWSSFLPCSRLLFCDRVTNRLRLRTVRQATLAPRIPRAAPCATQPIPTNRSRTVPIRSRQGGSPALISRPISFTRCCVVSGPSWSRRRRSQVAPQGRARPPQSGRDLCRDKGRGCWRLPFGSSHSAPELAIGSLGLAPQAIDRSLRGEPEAEQDNRLPRGDRIRAVRSSSW